MKNLYDAIRALRPQMMLPYEQRELQAALWYFERSNRGHSHDIELLARAGAGQPGTYPQTPGFARRRDILRETTRHLMGALRFERAQWPGSPEFEALWTMRDASGLIATLTRTLLLGVAYRGPWAEHGYGAPDLTIGELRDGHLELGARIQLRGEALQAARTLRIPTEGFDSLEGSWQLLRDATRMFDALCRTLGGADEFASGRREQSRRTRLRKRLDEALRNAPTDDLAWAFEHWQELRPPALARAATPGSRAR